MDTRGAIFAHTYKIVKGQATPETALADGNYPASGSYPDVSGCERFHVLIHLGAVDSVIVFEIKQTHQATDPGGGEDLDVIHATYAKHTIDVGDDGEFVTFTIETDKLATDHHFVTCVVTGATGNDYADIFFLLPLSELPVTQATAVLPAASQKEFVG